MRFALVSILLVNVSLLSAISSRLIIIQRKSKKTGIFILGTLTIITVAETMLFDKI